MAWISILPEARTQGGESSSVFSLHEGLMRARRLFADTMHWGGSGLGRYREELIAVSISSILRCKF